MNSQLNDIKSSLTSVLCAIKDISESIINNNLKLVHFLLDTIKILVPSAQKPTKVKIEELSQRLSWHKVGNIANENLFQYVDKLWDTKKNNNINQSNQLNLNGTQNQTQVSNQQTQLSINNYG